MILDTSLIDFDSIAYKFRLYGVHPLCRDCALNGKCPQYDAENVIRFVCFVRKGRK